MKIAVYGTGGVGGYFGGRLAQAGAKVYLIARGRHLDALQQSGLRVRSPLGDFHLTLPTTDDPETVGQCDFVLFTVKSYDTEDAAARLHPLLHSDTAVISFQNGVDNEDKIAEMIGWRHVVGGAAFILSHITEPGVIEHSAGPARIVFGEMDGSKSERTEGLLQRFDKATVDAEVSDNIRAVLWNKFGFICAAAGMTAAARTSLGRLRAVPESWAMFRQLSEEVCALAAAEGVALPDDTPSRHLAFAEGLEPQSFSSLYQDLNKGRPLELEALHGTVVRKAAPHGLDVPMNRAVYGVLKPWVQGAG